MGTELVRTCVKEESMEISPIPPGFESLAPYTLKKLENKELNIDNASSLCSSESQTAHVETECIFSEDRVLKSLRRRPCINYGLDNCSDDESEPEQNLPLRSWLPKGVIRGCDECFNCQKVTAKCRPEEACRPDLQDAPVFHPTEEEFEDTLKYIESIRSKAEAYGICRIVPPPSWKPPCPLKQSPIWDHSMFSTRIQRIDRLQNRDSAKKILRVNHQKKRKKRRCMKTGVDHGNTNGEIKDSNGAGTCEAERFGFEPGPDFTLHGFQVYANDFKNQYFRRNTSSLDCGGSNMIQEHWEPSVVDIEGEYWRMVERPTEEIEVLYGADLETGLFGSGFPKQSNQVGSATDMKYVSSGWNLNNFPRLTGSVLAYESSDISGVLVPWLYIGMCFSSFCWHVEDHHLYSMNYMHWGSPKMWYGVPGTDALKLEAAMRKHLPDLFEEQPDLLHKLVTQLSPSILKSEGVPVYRCVQSSGEFVLTFPRAYHAGFNCGFNCAEAVNVAPVDWLPHGQKAIELYHEQGRRTSISHDKLLLGAAREAVKAHWELNLLRKNTSNNLKWKDVCGKNGILYKALKERVEMERVRREFLCKELQALKMESTFDANSERECSVCLFDLHLSAAGCHYCSPDKYACLNHAKQLCSCSWGAKFCLIRYDIKELNILVEALEGKLSAIYRWAKLDFGLSLSFRTSKENSQVSGLVSKSTSDLEGAALRGLSLASSIGKSESLNSTKAAGATCVMQKEKQPSELALEKVKVSSNLSISPQKAETAKPKYPCKKESPADLEVQGSIGNLPHTGILIPNSEKKQPLFQGNSDVILLSDDEEEEMSAKSSERVLKTPKKETEDHDDLLATRSCLLDMVSKIEKIDAPVTTIKKEYGPDCTNGENNMKLQTHLGISQQGQLSNQSSSSNVEVKDIVGLSSRKDNGECTLPSVNNNLPTRQPDDSRAGNESGVMKLELETNTRLMDNLQNSLCNPSGHQNNLDRYFRQKGPRIAKVVRRINCSVEPLQFGVVRSGKLWCDSQAIYPQGFRSRVRYINVLDPSNNCYYVSEILDAGRDGPLYMVSLVDSPSEVFVHISATRCWEMVRERVNQEITKQHKLGRLKLPPLQPPGSLDGMEMFGFSSPAIVQVIQAMDQNRVCSEYWKSRPLMQMPEHSNSGNNSMNVSLKGNAPDDLVSSKSHYGVDSIINGLFKKATCEELRTLYSILNNDNLTANQRLVTRILDEEIHKRPK